MPRLYVVYDTNIYRGVKAGDFENTRQLERNHSVVAVPSYWVVSELLSHIVPGDSESGACIVALQRLARHTARYDGSQHHFNFLGDIDDQIGHVFLDHKVTSFNSVFEAFARLMGVVVNARSEHDLMAYEQHLIEISKWVNESKESFARAVWDELILRFDPAATTWNAIANNPASRSRIQGELQRHESIHIAATVLLQEVLERLNIQISSSQFDDVVNRMKKIIPTPLALQNQLLLDVVISGLNLTTRKNMNTYWDVQIAFSTTTFAELNRIPLWLVTEDTRILNAARVTASDKVILHPDRYKSLLNLDVLPV